MLNYQFKNVEIHKWRIIVDVFELSANDDADTDADADADAVIRQTVGLSKQFWTPTAGCTQRGIYHRFKPLEIQVE